MCHALVDEMNGAKSMSASPLHHTTATIHSALPTRALAYAAHIQPHIGTHNLNTHSQYTFSIYFSNTQPQPLSQALTHAPHPHTVQHLLTLLVCTVPVAGEMAVSRRGGAWSSMASSFCRSWSFSSAISLAILSPFSWA